MSEFSHLLSPESTESKETTSTDLAARKAVGVVVGLAIGAAILIIIIVVVAKKPSNKVAPENKKFNSCLSETML